MEQNEVACTECTDRKKKKKKISHRNSGWKRTKMCKTGAKGQGRRQQAEQLQQKKSILPIQIKASMKTGML